HARAEHGDEEEREHEARQREEHLDDPVEEPVEPARAEGGAEPEHEPQCQPDRRRRGPHAERLPGPVDHPRVHVTSGGVGAEQRVRPRRPVGLRGGDGGGVARGEEARPQRGEQDEEDDDGAHHAARPERPKAVPRPGERSRAPPGGRDPGPHETTSPCGAVRTASRRPRSRGSTTRSSTSATDMTTTYPSAMTSTTPMTSGTSREWVASMRSRPRPGRPKSVSTTTAPESREPNAQPL